MSLSSPSYTVTTGNCQPYISSGLSIPSYTYSPVQIYVEENGFRLVVHGKGYVALTVEDLGALVMQHCRKVSK